MKLTSQDGTQTATFEKTATGYNVTVEAFNFDNEPMTVADAQDIYRQLLANNWN